MITLTQLTKTFPGGVQALRGVDLEIGPGMFGLVGPNGAGKTTLMRILAGLLRPSGGSVRVLGYDVTTSQGKRAVKSILGYLPQELGLYPDLSAWEFLDYVAILKGINDTRERRRQVEATLELVHLGADANRRLKTFSGGMKRRIGIAQALLGQPELLVVDEPTAGLDPEERVHFRNLLAGLAADRTVILSTHIVEDISQSCTELAVLHKGRVIFHDSPRRLVEQARRQVWAITTAGETPDAGLIVVGTLQQAGGVQYRVLGQPGNAYPATPLEPNLEDGYIWLMQQVQKGARDKVEIR
jgi:ABC-type multidrug transport system ATPase subunit